MRFRVLPVVAGLVACAAPRPAPQTPAPHAPAATPALPGALRWVRRSAEYRAIAEQTYALAAERLPGLTQGLPAGSWAVILDADETVLDNSEYQRRRAVLDSGFTPASWSAWVRERAAGAVPGAARFTATVQRLGGRVVIVTNRADSLCAATRGNLDRLAIPADLVLCQPPGEADKNARFERVEEGRASSTLPALRVVEWVGDNILDFPHLTQAARTDSSALADFGRIYFLLPNPMYGSWERNTEP
jgi:5'-nucleotidase (lipoprotein e(P4) family)